MRIAVISDLTSFDWAGCEELWAAVAKAALQKNHEVALFMSRRTVPAKRIVPLKEAGLALIQPSAGGVFVEWIRTRISWKLASLAAPRFPTFTPIRQSAPDIVLISLGDALPRPEFLSDLKRSGVLELRYVIVCHNSYLFGKPVDRTTQNDASSFYLKAKRVLFVAERTRKETEHLLATELQQVTIVRNPVNLTDTSPMPMPKGSTVRIASLGRLAVNSKGQDILLAALGSSQFKDRDWTLSIYGSGPHEEYLKHLGVHYRIAEKIALKGYAHDIRKIWEEHHLLALPSRNESAPLVLVEAMLCGRPSVITDVGGVREWVSEPETGFIAEGATIDSFQSALERAWYARSGWEAIGQRARAKALLMLDPTPGETALSILQEAMKVSSP
jgi:L-malate glycosyltransferase